MRGAQVHRHQRVSEGLDARRLLEGHDTRTVARGGGARRELQVGSDPARVHQRELGVGRLGRPELHVGHEVADTRLAASVLSRAIDLARPIEVGADLADLDRTFDLCNLHSVGDDLPHVGLRGESTEKGLHLGGEVQ